MKYLFYFLITTLLFFSCQPETNEQIEENGTVESETILPVADSLMGLYWKKLNLKEKVFKIQETQYHVYGDSANVILPERSVNDNDIEDCFYTFSSVGQLLKEEYRNAKGEINRSYVREFHENGLKKSKTFYAKHGNFTSRHRFEYNDKNQIIAEAHEDSVGNAYKTYKYFYDSAGNKIMETHVGSLGVPYKSYQNDFDSIGNKIEYFLLDSMGNVVIRNTCHYDEHGNQVKNIFYNIYKENDKTILREFDEHANNTSVRKYDINMQLYSEKYYFYDEQNQLIELNESDLEDDISWKIIMQYDNHNNLIRKLNYENGELYLSRSFQFTYDHMGNWIKRIDFKNKKAKLLAERELEYF